MHQPAIRHYRLFGLTIASEIALPELVTEPAGGGAEVRIVLTEPLRASYETGHLLDVDGVAKFRIADGTKIAVEVVPGADPRDVRLFLLGSAMGILLHQRGALPLHANAVVIDRRAVAFMGPSGAGKSTLAAWFHDAGFALLADDVVVVDPARRPPLAYPGLARLRLCADALQASGRSTAAHRRSYRPDPAFAEKFDVTLEAAALAAGPTPLAALFVLGAGERLAFEPLGGAEAVEAIAANTYRGGYVAEVAAPEAHFAACIALARAVPVMRLVRPFDRAGFDAQCRQIVERVRALDADRISLGLGQE